MKTKKSFGDFLLDIVVIVLICFSLFPLAWIFITSLKLPIDTIAIPPKFIFKITFENYIDLFYDSKIPFLKYFSNSAIITVSSTLTSIVIACLAGYSLARLRPKGSNNISMAILGARMLPPIVLVVPLYLIIGNMGMLDTKIALIVPYTALNIPLATWMMRSYFLDLPVQLEEAALIDGCNWFTTFLRIIIPISTPGIAATGIFSFVLSWNDFVLALPLTTTNAVPLPIIASRVRVEEGVLWGRLGAISIILALPVLIYIFFAQKYLVSGLTAGAVKE